MAKIFPHGWEQLEQLGGLSAGMRRELETLRSFATGLTDDYTVFHSVHWTRLEHGSLFQGEVDFVVMNRAGDILLIEQKSGFLSETPDGLSKTYGERSKLVAAQISRTQHAIEQKLRAALKDLPAVRVEPLFYCPDYTVRQPLSAGLSPERIVDAKRRDALCAIISKILPAAEETPQAARVAHFMADMLQLEADVSAMSGEARRAVTRVSGGLAQWGRSLHFSPWRLHVRGTAGSGKTQLALAEYSAALGAGLRPLYVCFNRPLADHMAAILPPGGLACTFHMLCERILRDAGEAPDFSREDAFGQLIARAGQIAPGATQPFDCVIVDEGQDIEPAWRELIFRLARADARLLWLEDPMQNLYAREDFAEPGWVRMDAMTNYRSPLAVIHFLQRLLPDAGIRAGSPVVGHALDVLVYRDGESFYHKTREALRVCFEAGFRVRDVALLSYPGQSRSSLMPLDALGSQRLRHFTGRYDSAGQPIYSEGELLVDTVFRFKGQSAPAVVFAEIDFETLDEQALRRIFAGCTRATLKLVLVISERAARLLAERL